MRAKPILITVSLLGVSAWSNAGSIVEQWDFNNTLNATVGDKAAANGTYNFENSTIAGQTAQVIRLGDKAHDGNNTFTSDTGSYIDLTNPIGWSPNGPVFDYGNGVPGWGIYPKTYQYTLLMDMFIPTNGDWRGFFDTKNNDFSDWGEADLWLRGDDKLGVNGIYSADPFPVNQWARVAIVADLGVYLDKHNVGTKYQVYVNGNLFESFPDGDKWDWIDNRWTLDKSFTLGYDPWGEDIEMLFNSVQLRDYVMSADEIKRLGGATAGGLGAVPEPATMGALALGLVGLLARRRRK